MSVSDAHFGRGEEGGLTFDAFQWIHDLRPRAVFVQMLNFKVNLDTYILPFFRDSHRSNFFLDNT